MFCRLYLAGFSLALAVVALLGCRQGAVDAVDIATAPLLDASKLAQTDVIPFSDGPLQPDRNYIYCSTFALAWDELEMVVGEPPVLAGAEEWSEHLNDDPFDASQLSEDAYLARAGRADQGIAADIRREMAERFPRATMRVPDPREKNAVLIFAYLLKTLPFRQAFDHLQKPVRFASADGVSSVQAFGIELEGEDWEREGEMRDQVAVLDYVSDDDFIISLQSTRFSDKIILAKVQPSATLRETIDAVDQRTTQPAGDRLDRSTWYDEPVAIPVVALCVEREFQELSGKRFTNAGAQAAFVSQARQLIRFRLDERGAELESVAEIVAVESEEPEETRTPRRFIFNKPFLLLLHEQNAAQPYFAMWVANTDVLQLD